MGLKILVVDKVLDHAASIIGQLGTGEAEVIYVPHTGRAISSIRNNQYHLIVLGDRLEGGDTYDVGLEIKNSNLNRQTPVVCIAYNATRLAKLANHLRPYSYTVDPTKEEDLKLCVDRITEHLKKVVLE